MDVFPDAVKTSWTRLAEFGIDLLEVNDRSAEGESSHVRILIVLEMNGRVFTMLAPPGGAEGSQEMMYLHDIMQVVAPELQFAPRDTANSPQAIQAEVDRQIQLVAEHCRPLLEGDFRCCPERTQ